MAVTLIRAQDDADDLNYGVNGGGVTRRWWAHGSDDELEVIDAAAATAPHTYLGFIRQDFNTPRIGPNLYKVNVRYGTIGLGGGATPTGVTPVPPTAPGGDGGGSGGGGDEPLGAGFTIDITADQVHITQSKKTLGAIKAGGSTLFSGSDLFVSATIDNAVGQPTATVGAGDIGLTVWISGGTGWTPGAYVIVDVDTDLDLWILDRPPAAPGATGGSFMIQEAAPDMKGAIGVTKDRVEGVDIFGPKFDWTRAVSRETVTRNYIRTLRRLVGKKNAAPFYGSDAGEVLYLGASGSANDNDRWSLTHKFSEIENQSNIIVIPDQLVIPFKRGWDYVWFTYKKDESANQIIQTPTAAYVEEVVDDGDFSLIGIGY